MDFTTKVENGTAILGVRMMCCHKPPGRVGKLWRVDQSSIRWLLILRALGTAFERKGRATPQGLRPSGVRERKEKKKSVPCASNCGRAYVETIPGYFGAQVAPCFSGRETFGLCIKLQRYSLCCTIMSFYRCIRIVSSTAAESRQCQGRKAKDHPRTKSTMLALRWG